MAYFALPYRVYEAVLADKERMLPTGLKPGAF